VRRDARDVVTRGVVVDGHRTPAMAGWHEAPATSATANPRQVPGVHTVEPMVVRSPLGWEPVTARPARRGAVFGIVVLTLLIIVAAARLVTVPYYALAPGSARRIDDLIVAKGAKTYPPRGRVLLTTIRLSKATVFDALTGWLRSDVDIIDENKILPPQTNDTQYRQFEVQEMDTSKQTAIVVALRRLGYQVTERGEGALIERVLPQFPSSGRIEPGEVIRQIDGRDVKLISDATAAIALHHPGELMHITVSQPNGSRSRAVDVPTASDPQQGGKPILGVILRTYNQHFDLPFDISIRSGDIGGPSAGLAFTLGVIDELTAGELTGGRKVAVTGTIEIDGRVGDVGGVAQKTSAVRAAGAEVFLVPAGEYDVAKQRAGKGLTVIKVTTLQEALDALASVGGDLGGLSAAVPGGTPPR
jgi:PDZ domain-containing protein